MMCPELGLTKTEGQAVWFTPKVIKEGARVGQQHAAVGISVTNHRRKSLVKTSKKVYFHWV